jgi:hypothetical protein
MSLNDGQIPNPNDVSVVSGTGYHRVEGNRRALRNGPVSDLPPEIPTFSPLYLPRVGVEQQVRLALRRGVALVDEPGAHEVAVEQPLQLGVAVHHQCGLAPPVLGVPPASEKTNGAVSYIDSW